MTALPYERATTGKNAIAEMQKILRGFGASSFGCMEDFDKGEVIVQFVFKDRPVTIRASYKGYAEAMLRARTRRTNGMERAALKQGQIAVYSILRDWIKGQITAVSVGMLSFEGAFLGQIQLPTGETILERLSRNGGILQIEATP